MFLFVLVLFFLVCFLGGLDRFGNRNWNILFRSFCWAFFFLVLLRLSAVEDWLGGAGRRSDFWIDVACNREWVCFSSCCFSRRKSSSRSCARPLEWLLKKASKSEESFSLGASVAGFFFAAVVTVFVLGTLLVLSMLLLASFWLVLVPVLGVEAMPQG